MVIKMKWSSVILSTSVVLTLFFIFKNDIISETAKTENNLQGTWSSVFEYIPENATPGNEITDSMKSTVEFKDSRFKIQISDLNGNLVRKYEGNYSVENDRLHMKLDIQKKECCFDLKPGVNSLEVFQEPAVKVNKNISIFLSNFMWDYKPVLKSGSFKKVN